MEQALRSSYEKTLFHVERLSSKTGSPFCTSSRRCFGYSQALSQRAHRIPASRPRPPIFGKNTKIQGFSSTRTGKLFHVERYYFYSVPCGTKYSLSQILKEEILLHVEHLSSRVRDHFIQRALDVLLSAEPFSMDTTDTINKILPSCFWSKHKENRFLDISKGKLFHVEKYSQVFIKNSLYRAPQNSTSNIWSDVQESIFQTIKSLTS